MCFFVCSPSRCLRRKEGKSSVDGLFGEQRKSNGIESSCIKCGISDLRERRITADALMSQSTMFGRSRVVFPSRLGFRQVQLPTRSSGNAGPGKMLELERSVHSLFSRYHPRAYQRCPVVMHNGLMSAGARPGKPARRPKKKVDSPKTGRSYSNCDQWLTRSPFGPYR